MYVFVGWPVGPIPDPGLGPSRLGWKTLTTFLARMLLCFATKTLKQHFCFFILFVVGKTIFYSFYLSIRQWLATRQLSPREQGGRVTSHPQGGGRGRGVCVCDGCDEHYLLLTFFGIKNSLMDALQVLSSCIQAGASHGI